MTFLKNLSRAGVLAAGVLALAIPAHADTFLGSVGIIQSGFGQSDSVNLGAVNTVHCSLMRVREKSIDGVTSECRLFSSSGQWKLRANVETISPGGGWIHCEAACYQ